VEREHARNKASLRRHHREVDLQQGYLNFKGYKEFAAENRPDGWNAWATLIISPAAATASTMPRRALLTK